MAPLLLRTIRLLLVDDHTILRAGLRLLLDEQPGLTVVGEAATAPEALAIATSTQPDIIVLDLNLGGEDATDCIPLLLAAAPEARVLVLTGVCDPDLHRRAVRFGAMGLVPKEKAAEVFLQAIMKVHAGEVWIERTMMASVLSEMTRAQVVPQPDPEAAKIATLTARERDVIALVSEGLKNRQIARRLHLSEATVSHHLTAIFAKLGSPTASSWWYTPTGMASPRCRSSCVLVAPSYRLPLAQYGLSPAWMARPRPRRTPSGQAR